MSANSTLPGTPARPWLIVLAVLVGTLVVLGAWWAGHRAEGQLQAEQLADAPAGLRASASAASAAGASQATGAASAAALSAATRTARPGGKPPAGAASASTLTAELSPLPWPFWEFRLRQPLPPRSPPLVPPPWRMIGATKSAAGWSLVVLRQGRTAPEFFKVGESLPGGYRVAAISQDDVTLESGGRSVVLSFIGTR